MEADKDAQDAMLCINSGATLDDPNRFKFEGSGYYIKSAEEMRELFKDHPDACDNTLEIAERCNVIFDDHEDGAFMPQFDCPEGWDETSLFLKKVEEGLEKRYDGNPPMEVLKAGRLRMRRHLPDAVLRLLPRRRRLHQLGEGARRDEGRARLRRGLWSPMRWASPSSIRSSTA